jgi:hypothetical protein
MPTLVSLISHRKGLQADITANVGRLKIARVRTHAFSFRETKGKG